MVNDDVQNEEEIRRAKGYGERINDDDGTRNLVMFDRARHGHAAEVAHGADDSSNTHPVWLELAAETREVAFVRACSGVNRAARFLPTLPSLREQLHWVVSLAKEVRGSRNDADPQSPWRNMHSDEYLPCWCP